MIARTKQRVFRALVAVTALFVATLAIFYGTAQAQSFTAASATSSVEDAQSVNRNDANATASRLIPESAAHWVVAPGDSLWSIAKERLHPGAAPEQIMNEVERIFEFNRDRIGDDPNLILPGQELSFLPVAESAAEWGSEPIQEPLVLPDLPDGETVPPMAGIVGPPHGFYVEERRLLGLGSLLVSSIIGILGFWKLYPRSGVGSPASRRVHPEEYSENYALVGGTGGDSMYASGPALGSLVAARATNKDLDGLKNKESPNGQGCGSFGPATGADAASSDSRMPLLYTEAYEDRLAGRRGVGAATSAMLLNMAEGEDYYTPPQAARILRLSRQRVTQMLQSGEMEGKQNPQSGRWKIPQRVVHARLKDRPARARPEDGGSQDEQERSQRLIELESEVRDLSYRPGCPEAHRPLTA